MRLIQHEWSPISVRVYFPDGSNFKLLSGPRIFMPHNLMVVKYNNSLDSTWYDLLPGDSTMVFADIKNGKVGVDRDTVYIDTITQNLFVYYSKSKGYINMVDSLKR